MVVGFSLRDLSGVDKLGMDATRRDGLPISYPQDSSYPLALLHLVHAGLHRPRAEPC